MGAEKRNGKWTAEINVSILPPTQGQRTLCAMREKRKHILGFHPSTLLVAVMVTIGTYVMEMLG